jgi:hypothetical protein
MAMDFVLEHDRIVEIDMIADPERFTALAVELAYGD